MSRQPRCAPGCVIALRLVQRTPQTDGSGLASPAWAWGPALRAGAQTALLEASMAALRDPYAVIRPRRCITPLSSQIGATM